jgi:thiosulfate/3-mercaptopyruvate sulfurtransferase
MSGMHPLTSTAELAGLLASPRPPTVLDLRWSLAGPPGSQLYAEGHVPGAVAADLDADLSAPPGAGGRHPLPDPRHLQSALRRLGVRTGHPVVAYDQADGSIAARIWWLLRWAGHDEVSVLDGGFAAWCADGHPVSVEQPRVEPGDIVVRPGRLPVLDADQAARLPLTGVLLDARAPQRYLGETEPVDPRAGHIPGARNAPATGHTDQDGRWLAPAELAARFAALGVTPAAPVGAYCGSGVSAASVVLALELAGVTDPRRPAALYAGSWSHWCTDPGRPVATGPEPVA